METGSISFIAFLIASVGATLHLIIWMLLVRAWKQLPSPMPLKKDAASQNKNSSLPISIIIAAHNEQDNLSRFMLSWLQQDHPSFECILVLDRCEDGSAKVAEKFRADYANLRILEIAHTPVGWAPKKWAIDNGIRAAKNEWMAFTDADCYAPPSWLSHLSAYMKPPHSLILGLGNYESRPGWVNLFIQFETFYTALQYIGFAKMGMPYMGVGRNMAYTQSFYRQASAYRTLKSELSGDDDLLVNSSASKDATACCIQEGASTLSVPKETFSSWFYQKTRHVSAGKAYTPKSKILLGLFHVSHLCFYVGLFVTMIANFCPKYIGGLYGARMALSVLILSQIKHKIYSKKIIQLYPLFDFFIFAYNLLIVPLGLILKPEWKKDLKHPKTPRKIVN